MKKYSNSVGGGENLKINSISWGSFNFSNSIGGGGKKSPGPWGGEVFFWNSPRQFHGVTDVIGMKNSYMIIVTSGTP